jgi:mannose-6-phosphate isomerase-like protein (cupin superfamily)
MYTKAEYGQSNTHTDQEGFYVLEGTGKALVGDSELLLRPGICFIVPPGFGHAIKKDDSCEYIKLFFFHAAV